jgi:3-oxoacyl-[acyl-carrier protein] reductase
MDLGLSGRRAAVAASSSGLGFACAKALVDEGVTVAICGRDAQRLESAARTLGPAATPIVADVGTTDGARSFVDEAMSAIGGIDILIANAGGPPRGGFGEVTIDDYRGALELNFLSTVVMCEAAAPHMREQKWGRILAITSTVVKQPAPYLILSNTARAAVHAFLKTMSSAVAPDGVTVNALMPGGHATDRMIALYGTSPPVTAPVGRVGDPDDFGKLAAFLVSEHAGYVTGTSLPVDGGFYAGLF